MGAIVVPGRPVQVRDQAPPVTGPEATGSTPLDFATLALGSAVALFLYDETLPHQYTAELADVPAPAPAGIGLGAAGAAGDLP